MAYVITSIQAGDGGHDGRAVLFTDDALNDSNKDLDIAALLDDRQQLIVDEIRIEYAATATVGVRMLRVELLQVANIVYLRELNSATDLTASQSKNVVLVPDKAYEANGGEHHDFIPINLRVFTGCVLRVRDSAAIDAAADDMTVRVRGRLLP